LAIADVVAATLAEIPDEMPTTVAQVLAADDEVRRIAVIHVASEGGGGGDA
jgi:hypothetical protein